MNTTYVPKKDVFSSKYVRELHPTFCERVSGSMVLCKFNEWPVTL